MKRKLIDNDNGLRISVPKAFIDLYHLTPNDKVQWGFPNENGEVTIRFIKEED